MDIFDDLDFLLEDELVHLVEMVNPVRRNYTVRARQDNLNMWDDKEFIQRFRVSKLTVQNLLEQIEGQLHHRTNRNHPVPPLQQLLLTLRFLATGSFYISIADFGGIHKSTLGKIIQRVIHALASLRPMYIRLPQTAEEINNSVLEFFRIARFPRVLGAIDCTHVRLQSPGGDNAENFRNRKGYFSLNVQAVCNAKYNITDIVARWPGASHDSYIFNNSNVMMRFHTNQMGNTILLGDSGYPLREYIITPLDNPRTEAENLYNEAHIRTRNVIERTFGIWKRRFPVLSIGMRCNINLAQAIIVATAIVHNLACNNNDEMPENDADVIVAIEHNPNENVNNLANEQTRGEAIRRTIINYFQNLL